MTFYHSSLNFLYAALCSVTTKEGIMYIAHYILSLKRKYEDVNSLIRDELSRPIPNSLTLLKLKLKRLKIKEKIHKAA